MIFHTVNVFSLCVVLLVAYSKELRIAQERKGKTITVQNASPSFPDNPTYGTHYAYSDATCTNVYNARSILLDTCLKSTKDSVKYLCCKPNLHQ